MDRKELTPAQTFGYSDCEIVQMETSDVTFAYSLCLSVKDLYMNCVGVCLSVVTTRQRQHTE